MASLMTPEERLAMFVDTCVKYNTVVGLTEAYQGEPDRRDMEYWGLTREQYSKGLLQARNTLVRKLFDKKST